MIFNNCKILLPRRNCCGLRDLFIEWSSCLILSQTLTSLTCLTNGSWSFGNFSCEQGCYDVNAPPGGGNVSCDSDELWEGDQCTYSCGDEEHRVLVSVTPGSGDTTLLADPGPSGTISRTCRVNGTFNGTLPSCVSVCEQLSIPSNGTRDVIWS